MYIGLQEGWQELKSAVNELASGDLLLYREGDTVYFNTNYIYCNYAGCVTNWKNFIGYQNILFYKALGRLKDIAHYDGVKNIVYEEQELQEFLGRSEVFGLDYVYFEDIRIVEQVNKVIEQAKPFYEEIKDLGLKEQLVSFLKRELDGNLPSFYANLLLLKALLQPRFADEKFLLFSSKTNLSYKNILDNWNANVVS